MNLQKLEDELVKAESGNAESRAVVFEVLRPLPTDSVEAITQKMRIFIRLMFTGSLKYADADYHREIDATFAEQAHALLTTGKPRYKGVIIIGFRESAKTTRVQFNQVYLTVYLPQYINLCNVVSKDDGGSSQFTMDIFNILAASKVPLYAGSVIPERILPNQKENKTMRKFTTLQDVTYSASTALQSKRGAGKIDIDETGEVLKKRPKEVIFDDVENELTVSSIATTEAVRSVMKGSIDGLDQISGFWILLGNYLSLRGNVAHFLSKYQDLDEYKIIKIPIHNAAKVPTWPAKYCATDAEMRELAQRGIIRSSIETIERNSENFETEFLNNPRRSRVYFDDEIVKRIDESILVDDSGRDRNGLLIIEEPTTYDRYLLGADTGKGIGKDQSAFVVWKVTGSVFDEVANFKSNTMKPEDFAPFTLNIATKYNNAFVVPENNYPGNEFCLIVNNLGYKNVYKEEEVIGVNTNAKTKPEMFVRFKLLVKTVLVRIRSRALYTQVCEYPNEEVLVTKRDDSGGHFDLLMSAAVGIYKSSTPDAVSNSQIDAMLDRVNKNAFQEQNNYH